MKVYIYKDGKLIHKIVDVKCVLFSELSILEVQTDTLSICLKRGQDFEWFGVM